MSLFRSSPPARRAHGRAAARHTHHVSLRGRLGKVAAAVAAPAILVATLGLAVATVEAGPGGWGALEPSPQNRTEVGAAKLGGSIYVLGGLVAARDATDAVVRYNIATDDWDEAADLPLAVHHPGVTAAGGFVWIYGGKTDSGDSSKRLYRFDPGADDWQRMEDAPSARFAMGFAAQGDRLYAAGGARSDEARLKRLDVYDISAQRWLRRAPMAIGRNHAGATFSDGILYVTGGRPGPIHGGRRTVEAYDPAADEWSAIPPLGTARSGHLAVTLADGRIVAFGGEERDGGETIEEVEAYDPASGEWEYLPDMTTPRHGMGGAADANRVLAIEGGPEPGLSLSNANEYLDVPAVPRGAPATDGPATAAAPEAPRNVIVVMADDMALSQLEYMPTVQGFLGAKGVTYTNNFAVQPLCCPSRATFLTGQYPHNHGVRANVPPTGGFENLPADTLNLWMQDAGYRTAWVGKYLNGYGTQNPRLVPPGWDEWRVIAGRFDYYRYDLNVNGNVRRHGSRPADYQTDVLARGATRIFRQSKGPLFMVVSPFAPHQKRRGGGATPAPRHKGLYADEPLPSANAFGDDLTDKPPWVALEAEASTPRSARRRWGSGLASLQAVDELVARLRRELRKRNQVGETVFAFTSDNGYLFGEHSLLTKDVPYEPSIAVPLVVRGPGFEHATVDDGLRSNADLPVTIAEITGAQPTSTVDGRSLLDATHRDELLIEGGTNPGDNQPPWAGIRTPTAMYAEYETGDVELYDLVEDPEQLTNVAGEPEYAALEADLALALEDARDCAGASCP